MKRKSLGRQNRRREGSSLWKWLKRSFAVAALVLLGAGVYFFLHSGFFRLRETVFYGNRYLSDTRMKALMGIKGYENLFALSASEISERLYSSPWIKEANVRKEYPGRLLVKVREAVPVALYERGGSLYIVDAGGNRLERLSGGQAPFLPVIIGRGDKERKDALAEALSLAKVIKDAGLPAEKNRIEIVGLEGGKENISLNVDGLLVKFGEGRHEEKLLRLLELSEEIKKRGIDVDYIDLRFANRVVVKPVSEARR